MGRKRRLSFRVRIAIIALDGRTIARMNPFHLAVPPGDFEVTIGFDPHAPHIRPDLFPSGDDGTDQISCAKSLHATLSLGTTNGKAMLIHMHHLPLLPARGLNQPGTNR